MEAVRGTVQSLLLAASAYVVPCLIPCLMRRFGQNSKLWSKMPKFKLVLSLQGQMAVSWHGEGQHPRHEHGDVHSVRLPDQLEQGWCPQFTILLISWLMNDNDNISMLDDKRYYNIIIHYLLSRLIFY